MGKKDEAGIPPADPRSAEAGKCFSGSGRVSEKEKTWGSSGMILQF